MARRFALGLLAAATVKLLTTNPVNIVAEGFSSPWSLRQRGVSLQENIVAIKSRPHAEESGDRLVGANDGVRNVPSLDSAPRRNFLASLGIACAMHASVLASRPLSAGAADAEDIQTKSPFVALSKNLLPATNAGGDDGAINLVLWDGPKRRGLNTEQMSDAVNDLLREREWFVTGMGAPELFSDGFEFSDPDVSLQGYEPYCRQVRRLFDQETARCEVVCCSVTAPDTITVLWRNSGRVTLGPFKVELKPYVVTTTLRTDPNDGNLIVSQVDEFNSDALGLLLYQTPLLRPLAGPPAPGVDTLRRQCNFYTCKLTV
mmetsp:Transcript_16202/g.46692  ORF Transcript_16202/g.46692 Transcript_16202/m.46692 type:complete len:317 (-) Transcript_16202:199-1149(-)